MVKIVGAVLIALLASAVAASAQQPAGGIRGMVMDKDFDAPLPGAKISVAETGQEIISTDEGNYALTGLTPGTYTLVISKEGYTRQVKADVVVSPGLMTDLNASLSGEFTDMEEFVVQDVQFGAASEDTLF
ncbi:MAG: carboxypeptidase-like regulatory domain-containing protein, partial [Candidatus Omnitrophica bacterium]|nr:carboxypeptidase-like regulatory domain-containing protein [Candidatus Omnitrophota bacterium]